MDTSSVSGLVAVVVAVVSLTVSGLLAARQVQAQRQANHLPAVVGLLSEFRNPQLHDDYAVATTALNGTFDPRLGITGLPADVRKAVLNVAYYYQSFAFLIAFGILDEEKFLPIVRLRLLPVWASIRPFVLAERQSSPFPVLILLEKLADSAERLPGRRRRLRLRRRQHSLLEASRDEHLSRLRGADGSRAAEDRGRPRRGDTALDVPVRPGEPSDAAFIVEMARLASVIEDRPLPPVDDPELASGLPASPDTSVLALDHSGRPIGAAWWHFREPLLVVTSDGAPVPELVVAVTPADRGRGVGRCLLDTLTDRARSARLRPAGTQRPHPQPRCPALQPRRLRGGGEGPRTARCRHGPAAPREPNLMRPHGRPRADAGRTPRQGGPAFVLVGSAEDAGFEPARA